MRFLRIIIMVNTLSMLMAGCVREDYSLCPETHNVIVNFSLTDRQGVEIFDNHITTVNLTVYDNSGEALFSRDISRAELNEFRGAYLELEPGEYTVLCWGNTNDDVVVKEIGVDDNPIVTYSDIVDGRVGNIGRLFYAKNITQKESYTKGNGLPKNIKITAPESGVAEVTAKFSPVHKVVNVYVKGFTHDGDLSLPDVSLEGVPLGLDYFKATKLRDGGVVEARLPTEDISVAGEQYALASFNTFMFDSESMIQINLFNPETHHKLFSVSLEEVLEYYSSSCESVEFDIILEFKDGSVEVIIPGWTSDNIDWDFN